MTEPDQKAAYHDSYAAGYDHQVRAYDCYIAEALFGLVYEYTRPGQDLLDLGIGSGLSSQLFAKAGLRVHGMDFSPAMLDLCRQKGVAVDLRQGDVLRYPWPYPAGAFDHVQCCGVLHFAAGLEGFFQEARRVLRPAGWLAFTTKAPAAVVDTYETQPAGEINVYAHAPQYITGLLASAGFERSKLMKCFVGADLFYLWVVRAE